jgi:hypothetical protein
MARPSLYTPELAQSICDMLSIGRSLNSICKDDDMPSISTVMSWLAKSEQGNQEFEGFLDSYLRAREAQADTIFDECLDIADDSGCDIKLDKHNEIVIDGEAIQRAKLRIDTRMRMAGKLKPKKYGDSTTLKGDKDNPLHGNLLLIAQEINGRSTDIPGAEKESE